MKMFFIFEGEVLTSGLSPVFCFQYNEMQKFK